MKWNDFSKVLKGDHQDIFINSLDYTQPGGEVEDLHPLVLSAKANSEYNPRYHEAMNGPDAEGFLEAMLIEYDQLQKKKAWFIVEKKKDYNVLGSTWVYKVKCYPDGRVKKLKTRLCVHGDQQIEGVDYFETYAPVVQWSTIRTTLILSVALKW
jgi:Reverse transcriptase (RNA-dependent DNA polymerase)